MSALGEGQIKLGQLDVHLSACTVPFCGLCCCQLNANSFHQMQEFGMECHKRQTTSQWLMESAWPKVLLVWSSRRSFDDVL